MDPRFVKPQFPATSVTRRKVLEGITGLSVAAGLSPLLASGRAFAAGPQRGGTLRFAINPGNITDSLDPATYTDNGMRSAGRTLANNLVEMKPDKTTVGELAEDWEASDGAKKWVFKLRRGVEFHNGKSLTSEDVVYSLRRHIAEDSHSSAKGIMTGISDIKADGPDTVIINHETGNADMDYILEEFNLMIIPAGFEDWDNFVGTGPYILKHFEPGVLLIAERNPNYWKPDRAWFDAVEIRFVNDPAARLNGLVTGQLDATSSLDERSARMLMDRPDINVVASNGIRYAEILMNAGAGLFADRNIRLAMKYAIDREAVLQRLSAGFGEIGNDHPIPSVDPFFNSELPQRAYDPDKAKWHLRQAGEDTLSVELHTSPAVHDDAVETAELFRESAKAAGISIDIKRHPADGYWSDVWMKHDFVMSSWGMRATPDMLFSIAFQCGAPWNEAFWCNDRFDQLLKEGRVTTDFQKRKEIYGEMQEIVHDDGGYGIYMFPSMIDGYRQNVGGIVPDPLRPLLGLRIAERAWFES